MSQLYAQLPLEHFIDPKTPDLTCFSYCKLALRVKIKRDFLVLIFAKSSEEGDVVKAIELLVEAKKFAKSVEINNQWLYMTTTVLFDWVLAR